MILFYHFDMIVGWLSVWNMHLDCVTWFCGFTFHSFVWQWVLSGEGVIMVPEIHPHLCCLIDTFTSIIEHHCPSLYMLCRSATCFEHHEQEKTGAATIWLCILTPLPLIEENFLILSFNMFKAPELVQDLLFHALHGLSWVSCHVLYLMDAIFNVLCMLMNTYHYDQKPEILIPTWGFSLNIVWALHHGYYTVLVFSLSIGLLTLNFP